MSKKPQMIIRLMKRADVIHNRIIIPKNIIEKYGRDFYFDIYDDGSIKLIPIKKLNKQKEEE